MNTLASSAPSSTPLRRDRRLAFSMPASLANTVMSLSSRCWLNTQTSRVREWKRRDWGEGGQDFGWWCTDTDDAFVGAVPLYVSARDELVELIGESIYDLLVEQLERPHWVPLPHPATRR